MAKKKTKTPVDKGHPALMPKLAWQELIQKIMAEHDFKIQYRFAEEIDVCPQTVSRWLGKEPALPEPDSFISVAKFHEVSEAELATEWASLMIQRYGAFTQSQNVAGDIREPAPTYGELELITQAKALEGLDLKQAQMEQRPFLYQHRREVLEHVREIEEMKQRLTSRLKAMLSTFRELYSSAVDTARRRLPQDG